MSDKPPEFKVVDRRRLTPEGEARTPDADAASPPPPSSASCGSAAARGKSGGFAECDTAPTASAEVREGSASPPPDIGMGYAQLLLSLATSAQIGLGLIPNPASGLIERNVAMARQTIDLLSVLEEKTRGNLTEDERQLQDELLYALRMQYVAAEQGGDLVKKG